MPYIQLGEFKTEKNVTIENGFIYIQYGTVGDSIIIRGKYIGEKKKEKTNRNIFENKNTLEQNKIRKAIKTYNLLAQKREELPEIDYDLRSNDSIYSTSSEDVFFHFKAFIQEGNADDVISEICSTSFIPILIMLGKKIHYCLKMIVMRIQSKNIKI